MPSVGACSIKSRSGARVLVPVGRAGTLSSSLDGAPPAGRLVSIQGHRGGVSPREPRMKKRSTNEGQPVLAPRNQHGGLLGLTRTEQDAVLAGLRLLQHFLAKPRTCLVTDQRGGALPTVMDDIEAIASDSGEPITVDDINTLCEQFNR